MTSLEQKILEKLIQESNSLDKRLSVLNFKSQTSQIYYIPQYLSHHFPNTSIDAFNNACIKLKRQGYIDFCPSTYIKLKN